WFWMMRGYSSEARVWFGAALSRHDGAPSALLAQAFNVAGNLAENQGEHAEAALRFEHGLEIYRAIGDSTGISRSLASLGEVSLERGHAARAREMIEEALALRLEHGERRAAGDCHITLSQCAISMEDFAAAERHAREGL